MNENGLRQVGQKPSVRPGWPSRERPTGEPHDGQVRRSSGTIGFSSTAFAASTAGTGGMDVRPAPSRAPRSRVDEVPTRRVTLLPAALARAEPRAVEASWFDARETVEGDCARPAGIVATEAPEIGAGALRAGRPADVAVAVDDGSGAAGLGAAAGRPADRRRARAALPALADARAGRPADVAVAVEDGARAAGLGARRRAHEGPPASGRGWWGRARALPR